MSKNIDSCLVEKAVRIFSDLFQLVNSIERDQECHTGVTRLQGYAIMFLHEQGNASLQELAINLRLSSSTVSRVMDKLVDRGLVKRDFDHCDRRRMCFRLSEEGENVSGKIRTCFRDVYEMLLVAVPVEEQESFLYNLNRIQERMRERYERCYCSSRLVQQIEEKSK